MAIKILKLTNGETIMTSVIETKGNNLKVLNPLEIRTQTYSADDDHMNLVAYQWMPMTEDENYMYVNLSHIVAMSNATDELAEYYYSAIKRILFPKEAEEKMIEEKENFMKRAREVREYLNYSANTVKTVH